MSIKSGEVRGVGGREGGSESGEVRGVGGRKGGWVALGQGGERSGESEMSIESGEVRGVGGRK